MSWQNCGESVNSVEGGVVGNAGFEEILATTYTGWCFGLTSEPVENKSGGMSAEVAMINDQTRAKAMALRYVAFSQSYKL